MENYKVIIGVVASVVSVIGYIPYIKDILKKKTKPHVFSWLMWSLGAGIVFVAQIVKGAGPGAWMMGVAVVISILISILAVFQGEKKIALSDWVAFGGSLFGLIAWILTSNPLLAVILITISDALAFIPTFRKTYYKPYEETLFTWVISSVKFIFVLFALNTYNATTLLYPIYLILSNSSFTIMMLVRRKALGKIIEQV
jgi:hypothetical protein